jgi:hypothetical protein
MANTFKSYPAKQITTAGQTIYTTPFLTQTVGIGMVVSNTSKNPYAANVEILRSANTYSLVTGATIPVGGSLIVAGLDQKLILEANDSIIVTPTANNCCDVWLSIMEVVPTNE